MTTTAQAAQIDGGTWTREFEPGRRVVGDRLKVELHVEAKPQPPAS